MNDYTRNDGSGGSPRGRFGGKRSGGFGRPQGQMHKATCATCGQACEVPFRPSGERPVYCRNCFSGQAQPPSGQRREYPKRPFPSGIMSQPQTPDPRIDDVLRQLVKVQDKLERILLSLAVAKAQATIEPATVAVKPKKSVRKTT